MKVISLLFLLATLGGCATHPITGRGQIIAVPALQAIHADLGFELSSGMQRMAAPVPCETDCVRAEVRAELAGRAAEIGAELQVAVRGLSPESFTRIDGFRIEWSDSIGAGSSSSAGGRIVLGSGLAALEPTDVVIAFLIAREMAHVVARHDEENSGAAILFSALGYLVPGAGLVAFAGRFVATMLGASMLKSSWAAEQRSEADAIALTLLGRTGTSVDVVAKELLDGITRDRLPESEWGQRYLESAQRIATIAAAVPQPAANDQVASGTLK